MQSDQMVPDALSGIYLFFGDEQTYKGKVQIRSSRQHSLHNLIRVPGKAPAKLKGSVDPFRIVCENYAEVTKCLFSIALNQKEVGSIPGDMRGMRVCFHGMFHTIFLLTSAPCDLIRIRQIQPALRAVRDSSLLLCNGLK